MRAQGHQGSCNALGEAATVTVLPPEKVNHPRHYNQHPSGIECITIIESMPFNVGTAIKYLWRAGLKDGSPTDEDYRKAIWYIERERKRLNEAAADKKLNEGAKS